VSCEQTRAELTAYLEGELDADQGSAVRGHLRGCADCRQAATDEAALRDGLRALPPVDPPASLWAGVQARLAAAEIADAQRPAWRRALARWLPQLRLGLAGVALAGGATLLVWRVHVHRELAVAQLPPASLAPAPDRAPAPPAPATAALPVAPSAGDVTAQLAAEPAERAQAYDAAVAELVRAAADERARWDDDQRQQFDARVAELRKTIAAAPAGVARDRAYRTLIRYLQGAAIRDVVAFDDHQLLAAPRGEP
jgi:hypothetical protein